MSRQWFGGFAPPRSLRPRAPVAVGAASADPDAGMGGSTSGSTYLLAGLALLVAIGAIVWASKSAATDFA